MHEQSGLARYDDPLDGGLTLLGLDPNRGTWFDASGFYTFQTHIDIDNLRNWHIMVRVPASSEPADERVISDSDFMYMVFGDTHEERCQDAEELYQSFACNREKAADEMQDAEGESE